MDDGGSSSIDGDYQIGASKPKGTCSQADSSILGPDAVA